MRYIFLMLGILAALHGPAASAQEWAVFDDKELGISFEAPAAVKVRDAVGDEEKVRNFDLDIKGSRPFSISVSTLINEEKIQNPLADIADLEERKKKGAANLDILGLTKFAGYHALLYTEKVRIGSTETVYRNLLVFRVRQRVHIRSNDPSGWERLIKSLKFYSGTPARPK